MSSTPPTPNPPPRVATPSAPRRGGRWLHLPQNRLRRLLFVGIYLLFCWGVALLGIKSFWSFYTGVPLNQSPLTVDFFYGEVRRSKVKEVHPQHADDHFDVLLLGGSVLTPEWGSVERCLADKLRNATGNRFRVFNLAWPAHTSRDSLIKYWLVADEQFDLVLVYDGINDVTMNCCPREEFRDDYLHFSWYREVAEALDAGKISLPIRLTSELPLLGPGFFRQNLKPETMEFGREIKTVGPLRRNQEGIIGAATTRNDRVLLMTFAYDIPLDIPDEKFADRGQERFRSGRFTPWGKAEYVAATLDAQNAAIRDLADQHPEVLFVDERKLMPEQQGLFVDPCHLSDEGSRRFVENLWPAVELRVRAWQGAMAGRKRAAGKHVPE
ncbi:MAG: SGNH/GDSL hydrolase family protein [Deltaproteobacteria bacterium]